MIGHSTYACCHDGCGHVICFAPEVERRLRDTHESWQCPAGHSQHFSGQTEQEKRIDKLQRQVTRHSNALSRAVNNLHRAHGCWCGTRFDTAAQLRGHKTGAAHWTHPELNP